MANPKEIASPSSPLAEVTASRGLRIRGQRAPQTGQRVLEVAGKKPRYRPSMRGRGIRTKPTNTVAAVLSLADKFFGRVFRDIQDFAVGHESPLRELIRIFQLVDDAMGRAAAQRLLNHCAHPDHAQQRTIVRHHIVVRGSNARGLSCPITRS